MLGTVLSMRLIRQRLAEPHPMLAVGWMALVLWLSACGESSTVPAAPDPSSTTVDAGAQAPMWDGEIPERHAAFVELAEHGTSFTDATNRAARVPAARLLYRFVPADTAQLPLCLILSGGPGLSSALLMRSFEPTPMGANLLGSLCHALFIDQRNTGFSYNLAVAGPIPQDGRFTPDDNNPYVDASDYLRVLIAFTLSHPDTASLPILILAQSYGGVRATALLDLLLHREAYLEGRRPLVDHALFDELDAAETTLGVRFEDRVSHQVLVQPTLVGTVQDDASGELFQAPGSVMYEIAANLGQHYEPCQNAQCVPYYHALNAIEAWGRSAYNYLQPAGLLERRLAGASELMQTEDGAAQLLGGSVTEVKLLRAEERIGAWRLRSDTGDDLDAEWTARLLGQLAPDDRYFMPFNNDVFVAFSSKAAVDLGIDWLDPRFGDYFLDNCKQVPTLVTRAPLDLVNYSDGLLSALRQHAAVNTIEVEAEDSAGHPGWLRLNYADGAAVRIRYPTYDAGHAVVNERGAELVSDIQEWLRQTL